MSLKDTQKTCPACKAAPGSPCVTGSGKVSQSVHTARIIGYVGRRNQLRQRRGPS